MRLPHPRAFSAISILPLPVGRHAWLKRGALAAAGLAVLATAAPAQMQFDELEKRHLWTDFDSTQAVALADVDGDGDGDPNLVFSNDGQQNRLYLNLLRQLDVPLPVTLGGPYQLDVYARYGPSRPVDDAVVMLSAGTARISLPPFGTFGLDPALLLALPTLTIPQPAGVATVSVAVPNNLRLVGLPIYAQAFVQGPVGAYLTNWTADQITQ